MPRNQLIQFRGGTAAAWTSANPVLALGEPGVESDTGREKRGDGTTAWASLAYTTDVSRLPTSVATVTSGHLPTAQQVIGFGHSLLYGAGARLTRSAYLPKLARMLGGELANYGVGGAIVCHGNAMANNGGDGGFATCLAANGLLQSGASGTGTGGGTSTYGYVPYNGLAILHYGINDIPTLGTNNPGPLVNALITCLSRLVSANVWVSSVAQWARTGSGWALNPSGYGTWSTGSVYVDSTVGDANAFTAPTDWETGKVLAIPLIVNNADNLTVTIAQNGTTIKTVSLLGSAICDPNATGNKAYNGYTIRLNVPGDGITINPSDVIKLTITSLTAGALRVDSAQIEASPTEGPVVGLVLPHTLVNLTSASIYNGYQFGPTASTNPLTNAGIRSVSDAIVAAVLAAFPAGPIAFADPEGRYSALGALVTGGTVVFGSATPTLFWDTVHPNSRGHATLASLIYGALQTGGFLSLLQRTGGDGTPQIAWRNIGGKMPAYAQDANNPTFGTNCSAGSPAPAYRASQRNEVRFQGTLACSSYASYPVTVVSGIPAGWRPQATKTYSCPCVTNSTPATVTVTSAGTMTVTAGGDTTGVILDGISYLADS
jgi:hypothetical protein